MSQLYYGHYGDTRTSLENILSMTPPGWRGIVERLIPDLFALGWSGQVNQIKEKFGTLRFYIGGGNEAVYARIGKAEKESYSTCIVCGKEGKLRAGGWLTTKCDKCYGD